MRLLTVLVLLLSLFVAPVAAQQSSSEEKPQPEQAEKKAKKEPSSQKNEPKKPEEATAKKAEPAAAQEPKPGDDKKEERFDMTEIAPVVTHHQVTLNGNVLKYTATAGRLPIKRADGKIEAEVFFVAYTLDGADSSKRPLTFAFNGGPGSATIWLHMGALGPRRVALRADGTLPPGLVEVHVSVEGL